MDRKRRILVAPLDWGLGHATRCIPIIWELEKCGFEVLIACSGRPLRLLMAEFPNYHFIKLQGYNIRYPQGGNMALSMLAQGFKIWQAINNEHRQLKLIIKEYDIDGVISDNRYGMYSKTIPCVFITHQLNIQSPILGSLINHVNKRIISKFSECWIPDNPQRTLSGYLSQNKNHSINCQFLGTLSRFVTKQKNESLDILAIVSGPEPQRSLFEKILINQLSKLEKKSMIVLGKPEYSSSKIFGNLTVVSHLSSEELNQAFVNADVVVCRSGYSTILDLAKLNKKAVFVPTPGQTEQMYLASYFMQNKQAFSMQQEKFNLTTALAEVDSYNGIKHIDYPVKWQQLFAFFERK